MFTLLALFPTLFVGPLETPDDRRPAQPLQPPSAEYLFGTDELGPRHAQPDRPRRPDLDDDRPHGHAHHDRHRRRWSGSSRASSAARSTTLLMRLSDFFLVLPTIVLALILAPIMLDIIGAQAQLFGIRSTLLVIVIVIGLTSWATTARVIRSQVLSLKERMFVDRARVIGSGSGRIMRRHILPNVVNLIVAQSVLTFATAVFTETTLAFIGLGDPTAPSWGQILNNAQSAGAPGLGAWWYIAPPAIAVVLVVLAFTLVGNALDDVLNPKALSRR